MVKIWPSCSVKPGLQYCLHRLLLVMWFGKFPDLYKTGIMVFTFLACFEDLRGNVSIRPGSWLAHRKRSASGRHTRISEWQIRLTHLVLTTGKGIKLVYLVSPPPFLCSIPSAPSFSPLQHFFFSGKKSHFQSLSSSPLSFLHQSEAPTTSLLPAVKLPLLTPLNTLCHIANSFPTDMRHD